MSILKHQSPQDMLAKGHVFSVARGLLKERPLQFQHGDVRVKSWQPISNSWSTSSQVGFARTPGRRKNSSKSPEQDFYTELLKSWSTFGHFLGNSPSHEKLQESSLQ